jgi:hypothetical protein
MPRIFLSHSFFSCFIGSTLFAQDHAAINGAVRATLTESMHEETNVCGASIALGKAV